MNEFPFFTRHFKIVLNCEYRARIYGDCPLGGAVSHGRWRGNEGTERRIQLPLKLHQRQEVLDVVLTVMTGKDQRCICPSFRTPQYKTKSCQNGNSQVREAWTERNR